MPEHRLNLDAMAEHVLHDEYTGCSGLDTTLLEGRGYKPPTLRVPSRSRYKKYELYVDQTLQEIGEGAGDVVDDDTLATLDDISDLI